MAPWEIPIRELMSLQERMNRLFDESLYRGPSGEDVSGAEWTPAVDVYELDREIVLRVEVSDVDRDEIRLDLEDNRLRIRGERRLPADVPRERYHRIERQYGAFSRSFELPPTVDREAIRAEYKNGVLTVMLPKRNENRAKHVSIKID
jgi:HSP20 family protein